MDFGFGEVLGFGLEVVGVWLGVRVGWCIWWSAQRFLSVGGDVFGVDQGAVLACDEMCADEDAVYAGFGD